MATLRWILRAVFLLLAGLLVAFVLIVLVAILFGSGLGDNS